jgi:arginine-tRNA-protein transferase
MECSSVVGREKAQDKPFPSIQNTHAPETSITGRNIGDLVDSGSNGSVSGPKVGNPRKAKEIRMERKKNKLIQRGVDPENIEWKKRHNSDPKTLEDFIRHPDNAVKNLSIRTVKVGSPEFEETFDLEYELYRSYQITVHNDSETECTKKQFTRFLCDNPFSSMNDIYGAYHQQYYVDDVLIAVGVVDVLPSCLSSVYFFYSKDYMNLSLGTFGALRELAYVRELNQSHPDIRYYYMGFYIHSCPKMRYKGSFSPSYLLCPEVYTWHLLDDHIRAELTVTKYTRLNKSAEINAAKETVNTARVLYKGHRMPYEMYKSISGRDDQKEVQEYVSLVGASCAESMLLYRHDS